MTIDRVELRRLAQAVADLEDQPDRETEHQEAKDALWQYMHCHTILDLLGQIEGCEQDAERYRLLRSSQADKFIVFDCRFEVFVDDSPTIEEESMDVAIDEELAKLKA